MPPALPPWPAPDAPAAAPGPTTRAPAAPPSRAGPPPRPAPAPPPSTPRPCGCSTARRRAAAPPGGPAACRAAPASGSSVSSRCAVAGRRARPDPRRCTAPAASRPTAPRTRSSRPPRPPRDPSPAAGSPGRAGPSGCPPRRGTAPPAPPRSSVPPPPPRVRLPQAEAQPTGCVTPQEPSTEHISRKPYDTVRRVRTQVRRAAVGFVRAILVRSGRARPVLRWRDEAGGAVLAVAAQQRRGALDFELGLAAVAQRRRGAGPCVVAGDEVRAVAAAAEGRPDVGHDVGLDPVGPQLAPLRHRDALDQVDLDRVLRPVGGPHGGEVRLPRGRVLVGQEAELGRAQAVLEGVAGRA